MKALNVAVLVLGVFPLFFPIMASAEMTKKFVFDGTKADFVFDLKDKVERTIYEDREIEETCYREVQTGTREECHNETRQDCWYEDRQRCETEYRRECTPITRRECRQEPRQECTPTTRRECHDVPRQECTPTTRRECRNVPRRECTPTTRRECRDVPRQECTPITRNECTNQQVCRNEPGEVCRTLPNGQRQCTPTNRRVCETQPVCREVRDQVCRSYNENVCQDVRDEVCNTHNETVCENVPDQVCRSVNENVCENVPDQVCRSYNETVCDDVRDEVCRNVPENVCRNVPEQVCRDRQERVCADVPVYGQEPYSCSRTVREAVGTELIADITGKLDVHFTTLAGGSKANEQFSVKLEGDEFSLDLLKASGNYILGIKSFEQDSQETAPKKIAAQGKAEIVAVAKAKLLAAVQKPLTQISPRVLDGILTFEIGAVPLPDALAVGLQLASSAGKKLFADWMPAEAFSFTPLAQDRTLVSVDLKKLDLKTGLTDGEYGVKLYIDLKSDFLGEMLNREQIPAETEKSAEAQVEIVLPWEVDAVLRPVQGGISGIEFGESAKSLEFSIGKVLYADTLQFQMKLSRVGDQAVIFDGVVPAEVVAIANQGEIAHVSVNLQKLGVQSKCQEVDHEVQLKVELLGDKLKDHVSAEVISKLPKAEMTWTIRPVLYLDPSEVMAPFKNGAALEFTGIDETRKILSFQMAKIAHPETLIFGIKVERPRFLRKAKGIFEGEFERSHLQFVENSQGLLLQVTLPKALDRGKYRLNLVGRLDAKALRYKLKDPSQVNMEARLTAKDRVKVQ